MELRNLSKHTQRTYLHEVTGFANQPETVGQRQPRPMETIPQETPPKKLHPFTPKAFIMGFFSEGSKKTP